MQNCKVRFKLMARLLFVLLATAILVVNGLDTHNSTVDDCEFIYKRSDPCAFVKTECFNQDSAGVCVIDHRSIVINLY